MVLITRTIAVGSVAFIALAGLQCFSCNEAPTPENVMEAEDTIDERWASIVASHEKIVAGMTEQEVRQILGMPDGKSPLFEPEIYKPRKVGFSWFYMKEPKSDYLSTGFAIRFSLEAKVMRVDEVEMRNP